MRLSTPAFLNSTVNLYFLFSHQLIWQHQNVSDYIFSDHLAFCLGWQLHGMHQSFRKVRARS
jgi:mannosyltransferase OCH1-like enzyme